ncbi:D-cysteine desulfhydrase family protein [Microbulbifer variabilis]|uniref:D-cysteine desulfhydrase family protein n=1 Tax=Microbulbifer variabilis TaxID=266805 RepID=UPI001CFECA59|nr:D-cysteine desulfhydrase family protein [Microbulbifer variabilis]
MKSVLFSIKQVEFPGRLNLAHLPTPLQPLDRISELYSYPYGGPRIWVKRDDLTESAMSGNKLRKLEFVVAEALKQGCDTLITCGGIQSNHCRTTALVGARYGLKVHLLLRGEPVTQADGNLLLDRLAGAEVTFHSPAEFARDLNSLFNFWSDEYRKRGFKPFCIPTGASDGLGLWGYLSASQELMADCRTRGIELDHIVCATGSGGTQAGLTLGCHLQGLGVKVTGYAVCDNAAYFQSKVREDVRHWSKLTGNPVDTQSLQVNVNADYIGPGYAKAEPPIYKMIEEVASLEGILLDPIYTGKAFYGLIQELHKGHYKGSNNLVFVHSGGQFALFPYRQNFSFQRG